MYEFDTYINTIIGGLGISKKKKEELSEEFKDHLDSLKSEFVENGFSESESVKRAIERFGKASDIKKKLNKSLFSYRKLGNVLFGIVITIVLTILVYIPIAGIIIAYSDYRPANQVFHPFVHYKLNITFCILLSIPIGYFLPIIFNRAFKVIQLVLAFSVLGFLIGVRLITTTSYGSNIILLLAYSTSVLLGGMAGYVMLFAANKFRIIRKNESVTGI